MLTNDVARELCREISVSRRKEALAEALASAGRAMGFSFYALSHHPQTWSRSQSDLRIHNYPSEWEESYDRRRLGLSDPIHRASHVHASGFQWRDVADIIPMSDHDGAMLAEARGFGIGNGYTIPVNVPGERHGSMTFATGVSDDFPEDVLLYAEALGHAAFQTARAIDGCRPLPRKPCVTDRQLEIVVLIGRDKTDYEMAQILGIKQDTIAKHVRNICERFDAVKRTSVPLRAVYAGLLSFPDILS